MLMPAPDAAILARRDQLVARLREVVPDGVIEDETSRRAYEQDALTAYRQMPMLVVLPSSTEEVAAVLRICSSLGVKVVPRGAGTSLSGGALPLADGVVVGLARLNRILDIDYDNRTVDVPAGRHESLDLEIRSMRAGSITRRIRRARSPAPSAATSPRTRAACIA